MDVIEYGSMHCDALERFKDGAITPFTCRQCADEIDRAVLQKKKAESEIKALRWMLESE